MRPLVHGDHVQTARHLADLMNMRGVGRPSESNLLRYGFIDQWRS